MYIGLAFVGYFSFYSMNKNDLVSLCDDGRNLDFLPERALSDSERNYAQFVVLGVYSKRFSLEDGQDKKSFYSFVLSKWSKSEYAKDFADIWKSIRTYEEILSDLGLVFVNFSEE